MAVGLATLALTGCADADKEPPPDAVDYSLLESRLTDLEGQVGGLEDQLAEVCAAIDTAYAASNSATEEAMFELQLACP